MLILGYRFSNLYRAIISIFALILHSEVNMKFFSPTQQLEPKKYHLRSLVGETSTTWVRSTLGVKSER